MFLLFLLSAFVLSLNGQSLQGVIDLHCHSDPDVVPRSIDALDLARLAREQGLRGILLKNHHEPTVSLAYLARKAVPGLEIFGGIVLNRAVGGINPAAVERMARVKGGWGRVVWLPTFDAENHVRAFKESRPAVAVARDGRLLPEVLDVLDLVARHKLLLATGHLSPAETMLLIAAARKRGIDRIVVTHALLNPVNMTVGQAREAAALGAVIEFVYQPDVLDQCAAAIRDIGADHCGVSSDLGQAGRPLHPEGLRAFLDGLRKHGISQPELDMMAKRNPARLLGLE
jgi:hypothetical protein